MSKNRKETGKLRRVTSGNLVVRDSSETGLQCLQQEEDRERKIELVMVGKNVAYDPVYCPSVIKWMKEEGYSITEVAAELKVSLSTIYKWRKQYPEFDEAIQLGIEFAQAWWERIGREHVVTNKNANMKINLGLYVFIMKNRFQYKDVAKIESVISIDNKSESDKGLNEQDTERDGNRLSDTEKAARTLDILIRTGAIQSGTSGTITTEAEQIHKDSTD